ncbi:hypothetical protein TVAG_459020 [Trichomonas vaginalis G3]|uniref:Protein-S-isoprenylcysteine O-methyltransferase n=1 Tax=Trichomonas vaginalis (strain ATCC PRA-98 / G3) TaxID=412133 RepID=A2E6A7_TRIV3|nr:protein C-terminal S-isoprenylcysteine carboxyl O-methyltransferase protein [Trichomonas vaginalis G3]EAY11830.1 hypothetical protein TVAG_459020 [Trichomonas vaginalis G3]KAI5534248.1 protein C-terminal S-isoprenylcysteine carboxyl O-methyltransferase protein [Trichomonas vaginalis G3]|eukprot:XP_001324053.1 hypothetical protein [Trichomonas vaginalis G3]
MEYVIQYHFHPDTTDSLSFLITKEYLIAFSFGAIEYLVECYFFPYKCTFSNVFIYIGLSLIAIGLTIRFTAIIQAGKSFTHLIAYYKRPEHKLITTGIYKYIRHPSYLGYLIFAVGTQIYLTNVISPIGFYIVLYLFFKDRIREEEIYLVEMFPEYAAYRARTPTWMFI